MFSKILKKSLAVSLLGAGLFGTLSPAFALDPEDKPAIEQIIREYIIQNPEIMLEAQQALQIKQEVEAKKNAAAALKDNQENIFNSKNQGTVGNHKGDVTVVEFFDYNCHYCQRAMGDMQALLAEDKNLKFVMKELPILSTESVDAHRISTAVYRLFPEKYDVFHNALLGGEGQKDGDKALAAAKNLGLDIEAIQKESQKEDVITAFREVNDLATTLGINGTPSYVVGDEVIFGALGEDVLRQKIENVRKCGKTICG